MQIATVYVRVALGIQVFTIVSIDILTVYSCKIEKNFFKLN